MERRARPARAWVDVMMALNEAATIGYQITTLTDVSDPAMRDALDYLLLEYYGVIVRKLNEAGMDHSYTPEMLKGSFWHDLHKVLPPQGRLIVARAATGQLVGCGTLQRVRADAGEVKRLYVRPDATGNGLGRAIVDAWIEGARAMNLSTLLVNVISSNSDPMHIFDSLGFERIARYPECADPIEADPYFIYMQHDLT
jgi:putative acetyltransferase